MYGSAYGGYYNTFPGYGSYYGYGQTPVDPSAYSTGNPASGTSTNSSQLTPSTPGGA